MFQHFGQRLRKDLRSIVDTRLAASETASGGLMRSSGMEVSEYLSLWIYIFPGSLSSLEPASSLYVDAS